ncbi:glycosyltransferase family 2 protein [Butyrivibrio sp. TB]|uniref:glycosyltransferase family 2 protein n=1 Tax=Butyrivibrio sp. TB TaxID=1520809 RepID=UPI0008B878A2|nr:glycosyltransferase family 2 protein [Butyrivibrio sp. TB]SEP95022.1 Glycosyltransferase involved in cell wall bisynthesis [Butyrivibrio sp. TB]
MSDSKLPKVSVITVVRNDKEHIESTLNSLFVQDYPNIEYIVIDGASTDGTLEILEKYRSKIDYLISEPDNGIYDAMNKGISISNGDYIGFLNSGDEYADSKVFSTIFMNLCERKDVIYGDSIEVSEDREKVIRTADFSIMEYGPIYRHGSSFVRSDIQKSFLFDLTNKKIGYALDWDFIYKLFKLGFEFHYSNIIIEKYLKDGISNNGYRNAWYNLLITSAYGNKIKKIIYFLKNIVATRIRK